MLKSKRDCYAVNHQFNYISFNYTMSKWQKLVSVACIDLESATFTYAPLSDVCVQEVSLDRSNLSRKSLYQDYRFLVRSKLFNRGLAKYLRSQQTEASPRLANTRPLSRDRFSNHFHCIMSLFGCFPLNLPQYLVIFKLSAELSEKSTRSTTLVTRVPLAHNVS